MKRANILKRALTLVLSVLACFSTSACKKGNNKNSNDKTEIVKTGELIVSDNTTEYMILMPQQRDDNINFAVSELQFGVEKATGCKLALTTNYTPNKKYLSVGKTPLYEEQQKTVEGEGLESTELRVVTIDDDVIMIGGESEYSVYAVYEFMEKSFGFKWYTYEDYYVKQTNDIELLKFDLSYIPKMQMRVLYQYDYNYEDRLRNCRRLRIQDFNEFHFIKAGHNMIGTVMPKSMYAGEHPEWYTKPTTTSLFYGYAGQLCVTNEEMITEFISRVKQLIELNWGDGNNKYFMLGAEDDWGDCQCESCLARMEITGSQTGNYIEFGNRVSREINNWVKTIDPNKTIYFPMYAYFFTEEAPVKEENGKYVAYSETAIPDPELLMLYAPLNNSFSYAFDDSRNTKTYNTLNRWAAISNGNFLIYSYGFTGIDFFFPSNDIVTMGASIGRALDENCFGWIEENGTTQRNACMQQLKDYIRSQLFWGTDKSVDELAYEFIDFFYAPVASEFKQYYASLKQLQIYHVEVQEAFVSPQGPQYLDSKYWTIGAIDGFDNSLNRMLEQIEVLKKSNPELYEIYFHRINREMLWTNWAYVTLHGKYFNDIEYNEKIDFLKQYIMEYKVGMSSDNLQKLESKRR